MISVFSQAKEIASDALFNLLPINFNWVDTKGYILGCNKRVMDTLNVSDVNDIIGKHIKDVASDIAWLNTKKVIDTGEYNIFEEVHINSKGESIYFLSIKSPIKSKDGYVFGVVNIALDITDRKMMEIEIKKAKEIAEISNKTKTEFLNNIRHDLRTRFCGIIGAIDL